MNSDNTNPQIIIQILVVHILEQIHLNIYDEHLYIKKIHNYINNIFLKDQFSCGLLSDIRKIKKSTKELRILVLGLHNAGKQSTTLKTLSNEDINQISPTHGLNINSCSMQISNQLYGMFGQEQLRKYWSNFFENTDALVFVIDSSDQLRLNEGGAELAILLSVKNIKKYLKEAELKKVPLLVFANKKKNQI